MVVPLTLVSRLRSGRQPPVGPSSARQKNAPRRL